MNNTKLQEFVTNASARSRITFGDVSRLKRDYLPDGVSSCEEAEALIQLDSKVGRADRAWSDWLVAAIVDFADGDEEPIDGTASATRERLQAILAATGASTKASRRIAREIRCDAERASPMTPVPAKKNARKQSAVAQPVVSAAVSDTGKAPPSAAYASFDYRHLAGSFVRSMPQPFFHPIL
jgi:hypothetical protein